jgi:DNA-binding PadR family transcriptional regulator
MKADKPTVQKRIFKAFSDLAILVALKDQAMTGYGINIYFMKKVGDAASPSMVYSRIASLERIGCIKCVRNRSGRAYGLTEEGRKIVYNMDNTVEETKQFISKLLRT